MNKDAKRNVKMSMMLVMILILVALFSVMVFADARSAVASGVSGFGKSMKNLFSFDAGNPGFLDFLIFFVIFLSLSWLGFSKWFESQQGSGKYAIIGLSVGLSIAFASALVFGAKFGIGKMLPFAFVFIGVALFILLYVLVQKMMKADTMGKKILAVLVAVILTIIIMVFLIGFLADKGVCEKNEIMKKVCGPDSIFEGDGETEEEEEVCTAVDVEEGTCTQVGPITSPLEPKPDTTKPGEKPIEGIIPGSVMSKILAINKTLDSLEIRLNTAIEDLDDKEIGHVLGQLKDERTKLENIRSNLEQEERLRRLVEGNR